jgi:hypothetical protein
MFSTEPAVLRKLQPLAGLFLVLGRAVIAPLTFVAGQRDDVSHVSHSVSYEVRMTVPLSGIRPS